MQQLPENLKMEVLHYVEFLRKKHDSQIHLLNKPKKRVCGSAKDKYRLAPDFDEPLDDFKDYMS